MARAIHLYVHVPFCSRKCPYCHFYNLGYDDGREAVYLDGIAREIGVLREAAAFDDARLATLYWGGGTPSNLGFDGFERLADLCLGVAPRSDRLEWTIEMNPADVTVGQLAAFVARGVNRVSLGVQSFDPQRLKFLGRDHDPVRAERAIDDVTSAGFDSVSIDLMFNLGVDGHVAAWRGDVERAFSLPIEHVSLYGLTLEPGTAFHERTRRGEKLTVSDDAYEEEYRATLRAAAKAGFEQYEVSSFARPGHRARHNAAYWSGVPYLGIGPAAHSFDGVRRWANVSSLVDWSKALATAGDRHAFVEMLTPAQRDLETLYLGLRTIEGVSRDHPLLSRNRTLVERLVGDGYLGEAGHCLRCTDRGFLMLDAMLDRLATGARGAPPRGTIDTM